MLKLKSRYKLISFCMWNHWKAQFFCVRLSKAFVHICFCRPPALPWFPELKVHFRWYHRSVWFLIFSTGPSHPLHTALEHGLRCWGKPSPLTVSKLPFIASFVSQVSLGDSLTLQSRVTALSRVVPVLSPLTHHSHHPTRLPFLLRFWVRVCAP